LASKPMVECWLEYLLELVWGSCNYI
jgi:hypothetical protein